jgi:pyroglutamyl-peptidase
MRKPPVPCVLLTGFGPFPGVSRNASGNLVRTLVHRARTVLPDYHFATAVLPTDWASAPRLVAALHTRHAPALALHFGVAATAQGFRIESQARNRCRASPDAAGYLPPSLELEMHGPSIRLVTIGARAIAAALEISGYAASLSDDAGSYLCNAVLYRSLALTEHDGARRVGFIHIPADPSKSALTPARTVEGALEIIKLALEPSRPVAALTSI